MPNKEYYHDSITESKLIKRNELYGFDGGKLHKFVQVKFKNVAVMNNIASVSVSSIRTSSSSHLIKRCLQMPNSRSGNVSVEGVVKGVALHQTRSSAEQSKLVSQHDNRDDELLEDKFRISITMICSAVT